MPDEDVGEKISMNLLYEKYNLFNKVLFSFSIFFWLVLHGAYSPIVCILHFNITWSSPYYVKVYRFYINGLGPARCVGLPFS